MTFCRVLLSFAVAGPLLVAVAARADEAIISRWYSALLVADRTELSDLLSEDARIRLSDLGIEQSKAEFIASMDEWRGAVAGAAIKHRIEKSENGVVTGIACYDFPKTEVLMQETFALADNRITANSQAAVAEICDSF